MGSDLYMEMRNEAPYHLGVANKKLHDARDLLREWMALDPNPNPPNPNYSTIEDWHNFERDYAAYLALRGGLVERTRRAIPIDGR